MPGENKKYFDKDVKATDGRILGDESKVYKALK
jgi:hypothetical protein